MAFHEFPKALYRGDEFTTVADAEAEAQRRAEGWHDHGQEPAAQTPAETASEPDKPRRGRQPRQAAETASED